MIDLYPLRLRPVLKRYLWGGRRFETVLGRALPPGDDYAESWDACDLEAGQSLVAAGPLAGTPLNDLVVGRGRELLGRHAGAGRFPLLLKLLDARQRLSVQVHPDDRHAARLDPPGVGKTEAWLVLDAEPGATIYAGLKPGVDRARLAAAVRDGTCPECLHQFQPQAGQSVFLPAGTVHALGAGLLVYEIQQPSHLTYRLFDWNRLGPDGQPRALHVDEALAVTDFARGPVGPQAIGPPEATGRQRLVTGEKFVLDRWELTGSQPMGGDDACHLLTVIAGSLSLPGDAARRPLRMGETILLPSVLGEVMVEPASAAVVLDAHLP